MTLVLLLGVSVAGSAQGSFNRVKHINAAKKLITEQSLQTEIEYLSGELCAGRSTLQRGGVETAMHIYHLFGVYDLTPFDGSYAHNSVYGGTLCRNVIGMVPRNSEQNPGKGKYIIVMAHYDGLGEIEGKLYPGADSNASGVAVMLALAKMWSSAVSAGARLDKSLIFVGLDAKGLNMAGAQSLYQTISKGDLVDPVSGEVIKPSSISMVVNLDILGSSDSPLKSGRRDYCMMLGGNDDMKQQLYNVNHYVDTRLDLGINYYGSKSFTDLFLNKVSDQKPFVKGGVRCVMFTSGITMDTNRESDTAERINYPVLRRRTMLIYHWLDRMTYLY